MSPAPPDRQPAPSTPDDLAFRATPDAAFPWQLEVAPGNEAALRLADGRLEAMRVKITRASSFARWSVQLNRRGLDVEAGHRRRLGFRARAARPRTIGLGIAKASAPWTNLGFYTEIRLTPEWQAFQMEVVPSESDTNARLHFDLGGRRIPVDLAEIELTE